MKKISKIINMGNGIVLHGDPDDYHENKIYRDNKNAEAEFIRNDPGDYGQCKSCLTGRIRWNGGSVYSCCECGRKEIRTTKEFAAYK
jgi:hypothetical protein